MRTFLTGLVFVVLLASTALSDGFKSVHSPNGSEVWGAGQGGRIWHSVDGGATWVNASQGINDLYCVYTLGSNIWIVGDAGAYYSSSDGGSSWVSATLGGGEDLRTITFVDNQTGFVAGRNGLVLKTTNGGSNWSTLTTGVTDNLNAITFVSPLSGFAAGDNATVIETTDGGTNWTSKSPVFTNKDLTGIGVNGSMLIITGLDGVSYKSTNSGNTWSGLNLATDSQSDVNGVFVQDANTVFFVGGGGYIRKSTDGGATFQYGVHSLHANLSDIYFYDAQNGWACSGTTNVILRTTDGGATWAMPTGTNVTYQWSQRLNVSGTVRGNAFSISNFNKNTIYVALGTSVYASYNRGDTWTQIGTMPSGGSKVNSFYVSPKDTNLWVAAYGSTDRIVRSTNYGATWTATILKNFSEYGMPLEMDGSHPDTLIFGPEDGSVYRSTDFGATWAELSRPNFRSPCDFVIARDSANIIWCGDGVTGSGQGQMFRSEDGGLTWSLIYTTSGSEIPTIGSSSLDNRVGYATAWGSGGVTKTTNYGSSWASVAGTGSTWGVDVAKDDPNVVMYGVYGGSTSYLSANAGASFVTASVSGANYAVLAYDRATFFSQQSQGIWRLGITYTVPVSNTQALAVLVPNGGEEWQYNTVHNILWSSTGVANVKIDYKTSPTSAWQTIVANTPNTGSYAWNIPNTVTTQARVRVSDVSDNTPTDSSNNFFSITASAIALNRSQIQFGTVEVGQQAIDTVLITNSGTAPLVVSNVSFDIVGYVVSRSSFTVPAGNSDTVKVLFVPYMQKTYNATMTVVSNAPSSPTAIPVYGVGENPTSVAEGAEIPLHYALDQNYPNPFNPSTVISYSIVNDGFVSLKVFNSIGQEVATLIDEVQKAGKYSVQFTIE